MAHLAAAPAPLLSTPTQPPTGLLSAAAAIALPAWQGAPRVHPRAGRICIQSTLDTRGAAATVDFFEDVPATEAKKIVTCGSLFSIPECASFAARNSAAIAVQTGLLPQLLFGKGDQMVVAYIGDTLERRQFDEPIAGVGVSDTLLYVVGSLGAVWAGDSLATMTRVIESAGGTLSRVITNVASGSDGIAFGTYSGVVCVEGTAVKLVAATTNARSVAWIDDLNAWIALASGFVPRLVFILQDTTVLECSSPGTEKLLKNGSVVDMMGICWRVMLHT